MTDRLQTSARPSVPEPVSLAATDGELGSATRYWLPFHVVEPAVVALDFCLIITLSVVSGLGYHWLFLDRIIGISSYLAIGVLVFFNFSAILAARGDYRFRNLINFGRQAREVTILWIGIFLVLLGIAFTLKIEETFSRGATLGFFVLGISALIAWRGVLAHLLVKALANGAFAERKVIVIGERDLLASSWDLTELRRCGYNPVRTVAISKSDSAASWMPQALRNTLNSAIETARSDAIEAVLLAIGWEHSRCIENILNVLSVLPVPVQLLPDENVSKYFRRPMFHIGATWAAELKRAPLSKPERALKRSIDVLCASIGLLFLSPLMLVTAIVIKLDSSGPILFSQRRDGFNGRSFRVFKFRTMVVLEDGPVIRQAIRDDPRVTRLGRLLRRTNIDELPQLFNVLRGEMSLIGPRPHASAHNNEYEQRIAAYAFRHHVKPGITGWAQVNGFRGETKTIDLMAKRVELDLWYINNWSIWLDIKILLRTLMLGFQASAY